MPVADRQSSARAGATITAATKKVLLHEVSRAEGGSVLLLHFERMLHASPQPAAQGYSLTSLRRVSSCSTPPLLRPAALLGRSRTRSATPNEYGEKGRAKMREMVAAAAARGVIILPERHFCEEGNWPLDGPDPPIVAQLRRMGLVDGPNAASVMTTDSSHLQL